MRIFTIFTCLLFLLSSVASYSSAPSKASSFAQSSADRASSCAQQNTSDADECECPEIPLVPMEDAKYGFDSRKNQLSTLLKEDHPTQELIKKTYQANIGSEKLWANYRNAAQHIEDCKKQEGIHDMQAKQLQLQALKDAFEAQDQKYVNYTDQGKQSHQKAWQLLCLTQRQRNLYYSQALVWRAREEEQRKQMQGQIQEHQARIEQLVQQLAAQNQSSQSLMDKMDAQNRQLMQQNYGLQQTLEQFQPGASQVEGASNQLPQAASLKDQNNKKARRKSL